MRAISFKGGSLEFTRGRSACESALSPESALGFKRHQAQIGIRLANPSEISNFGRDRAARSKNLNC